MELIKYFDIIPDSLIVLQVQLLLLYKSFVYDKTTFQCVFLTRLFFIFERNGHLSLQTTDTQTKLKLFFSKSLRK